MTFSAENERTEYISTR